MKHRRTIRTWSKGRASAHATVHVALLACLTALGTGTTAHAYQWIGNRSLPNPGAVQRERDARAKQMVAFYGRAVDRVTAIQGLRNGGSVVRCIELRDTGTTDLESRKNSSKK